MTFVLNLVLPYLSTSSRIIISGTDYISPITVYLLSITVYLSPIALYPSLVTSYLSPWQDILCVRGTGIDLEPTALVLCSL